MEKLCEMKHTLTEWAKEYIDECSSAGGKEYVNTKELGEVIDMIKDLHEAEMYHWKKCYYESVVKAMEESKDGHNEHHTDHVVHSAMHNDGLHADAMKMRHDMEDMHTSVMK